MTVLRHACALALAVASLGGCNVGFCGSDGSRVDLREGSSTAYRVHVDPGQYFDVSSFLSGSASNRSMDEDCVFAVYEFEVAPDQGAIAPLVLGEAPPELHPAGGRLIHRGVLPRSGDRSFEVPLLPAGVTEHAIYEDDEIDVTFVIALCDDPDVELDAKLEVVMCEPGDGPRSSPPGLMEQLW